MLRVARTLRRASSVAVRAAAGRALPTAAAATTLRHAHTAVAAATASALNRPFVAAAARSQLQTTAIGQTRPTAAAVQPPKRAMTTAANNQSIADLVKADHAKVTHLFDCAKKSTTDADKQHCMWKIIRELSIHAALEEEVLYPCLKNKFGAEGVKWADKSVAEHLQLKKELYELDQIDADPKNVKTMQLLGSIEKLNNAHIKEEEEQLFPWMAKNCSASGACMTELGKQYLSYKPYMPTRPHPDAPSGSYIGDLMLAGADYLRDVKRFSGVKDYPIGSDPKTLPAIHGTGGAKPAHTAQTH